MMDDKEKFAAYTQRHITFLLIYGLMVLIIGLLVAAYLPFPANDKLLALVGPLITGVYGLASGAVGFWIAKQRYQKTPDDGDMITQKITTPDGSTTMVTSPANAKPESVPTLATTSNTSPLAPNPSKESP